MGDGVPDWSVGSTGGPPRHSTPATSRRSSGYREHAPGMPFAHPTVEHFVPLFLTLGAATEPDAPVETTVDGFQFGLAKRSFQVSLNPRCRSVTRES